MIGEPAGLAQFGDVAAVGVAERGQVLGVGVGAGNLAFEQEDGALEIAALELFTALLLSLPGSPVIYYGDEIGMGDNIWLGDRDGVRTPMQWTPDRNAGFSRCDPARLYLPLIMDPIYGYQGLNVEAQERMNGSLLNWTRRMISSRSAVGCGPDGPCPQGPRPGERHGPPP